VLVPSYSPNRQDPALVAFGDAIRRIRNTRSLSQEALALAADIDRGYLGRIERGDSVAALLIVVRLARALEVSVEHIMRDACL
jgi:transcriptional regulator with XRE-family HTH domain